MDEVLTRPRNHLFKDASDSKEKQPKLSSPPRQSKLPSSEPLPVPKKSDDLHFLMVQNIDHQEYLLSYLEGLFHRNEMKIKLKSKMMQFDDNSRLCFVFYWIDESSK